MTTDRSSETTRQAAVVVDLFGAAAPEPTSTVKPPRLVKRAPRRAKAIGDTTSACAACHPDDPKARYASCFVCAPAAAIALG